MNKIEKIIIITIIILSAIISSLFIFNNAIYDGVDTAYHLSRIKGIANSWKSGDLMALIHIDDTGYGYAMGFFYSNLFLVIPCILYIIGIDIIIIYKIFILSCSLLTAVSMYICAKKITRDKYSAIISMILYTMCSYRIITMVAKAFVGEILSFIFIPIIILGLYELIFGNEKKWWIFSLGFIGILNSNLVMTVIMIIISAIILLFNIQKIIKNKNRFISLIKATILALLITAIFWMPMIEQLYKSTFMMKIKKQYYKPTQWLIELKDLFSRNN